MQTPSLSILNPYLSSSVRTTLEEKFYQAINAQAEMATEAAGFWQHPLQYAAFSIDRGTLHVRDIALKILTLAPQLNGIHFVPRPTMRLEFMKGYGVMLTYLRAIGFNHPTLAAENAAQMLYNDFFDQQLTILWEENSGNIAWRIMRLAKLLTQSPKLVFREMLTVCGIFSANYFNAELLNHPDQLRQTLQNILAYNLNYQTYQRAVSQAEQQLARAADHQRAHFVDMQEKANAALAKALARQEIEAKLNPFLAIYYQDFWQDSFAWLVQKEDSVGELVVDVIDTLRLVNMANVIRERGTRLRSARGDQVFLNHHSGNAVYAMSVPPKLFLLENPDNLLSGQVNLASVEFTAGGDLRLAFYRGSFFDQAATERAAFNAAVAILQIQTALQASFTRFGNSAAYQKQHQATNILLEHCDDNPNFMPLVMAQLILLNPSLKANLAIVPSLRQATSFERQRYLDAPDFSKTLADQTALLANIAESGHKIAAIEIAAAFQNVKLATISAGEDLMLAGSPASFVYVPLDEGLKGYPMDGYAPFDAKPFIPLGNVSVIRADVRNSHLIAEKALAVVMIPREIYLQYWHQTYTEAEFAGLMQKMP